MKRPDNKLNKHPIAVRALSQSVSQSVSHMNVVPHSTMNTNGGIKN